MNLSIQRNSIFATLAHGTGLLLLLPVVTMQFTAEVDWGPIDFLVMGALLFATASLFVLAARRAPRRYWLPIGALLGLGFLLVWAELAVGIFTGLGS